MVGLLLSPNNLRFVKRSLQREFPDVQSAHRTEAFAAAAGYRTHAALLADQKQSEGMNPKVILIDSNQFLGRLHELGHETADMRALVDILRSSGMPEPLWREYRNGDLAENDRWFRECKRRGIPNIYIQKRRRYVKLSWDCISIDPSDEKHVRDKQGTALVDEMFRRFQSLAQPDPGKCEFFGSAFVGSVDRLLPEVARNIADEFFILLYAPMLRRAVA